MLVAAWVTRTEELKPAPEVLGRLKGKECVVVTVPVTVMPSIQKKQHEGMGNRKMTTKIG